MMVVVGCTDHLKEGTAAYKEGDYATALKELQPLADRGNADAQLIVGAMNDNGEGIPVDYQQAVLWYRKAAEQGNPNAQYNLGMMYANGLGTSQDWVAALKWFNLATFFSRDQIFINSAKQAEAMMSPDQIKLAWEQSKEWRDKHK